MENRNKTEEERIHELAEMHRRVAELERVEIERKRAEAAAQEARNYAEAIIETLREPLVVLDGNLKVLSASRHFYDTFKATPEETVGKFVYDLGDRQWDIPVLRTLLEDILPRNTHFDSYEVDHVFPIIGHKSMLLNARRIHKEGIRTQMILLAIEDITDLKRAEEELKASETRYRRLFETAQDGILILDADTGRISDVNPFLTDMLGHTHKEFLGKKLWEIGAFRDIEASKEAFEKLQQKGYVRYEDLPLRTKEGAEIAVEFVSNVYRVNHQKVIQCNIRNITERKLAEEELRRSEKLFHTIAKVSPVGIFRTDKDGHCVYANERWCEIAGLSPEEASGEGWAKALHPEDREGVFNEWYEAARKDLPFRSEYRFQRRDGITTWVLGSAIAEKDSNGEKIGYVGTVTDITAGKQMEQALRQAHDELELRVQERTAELQKAYETLKLETDQRQSAERQLRQAQKMEALGTLAGGIAHDFNNILAGVIGNAEMALDDIPEGHPAHHLLRQALKAGLRGRELVQEILAFSRRKEEEQRPVRVGPIIYEALNLARASFPSTIKIRHRISTRSDIVVADPVQIHQLAMNLLANAAHAMARRGGLLEIDLSPCRFYKGSGVPHPDLQEGFYLRLTVSDTGHGMEKDVMERIFDPFFTTKGPGEGTGLGLSIVHNIVKNHKGAIIVHSVVHKGTTFEVYFPCVEMKLESDAEIDPLPRGSERILFVDDEVDATDMGREMLMRLGYDVMGVNDSVEALALFKRDPKRFDLVITDQIMPRMTGLRLAKQLNRIKPGIPVILCTGMAETVSERQAAGAHIRGVIRKPFTRQELAYAVRRLC
jgi:PAS domain S-box-containing protein